MEWIKDVPDVIIAYTAPELEWFVEHLLPPNPGARWRVKHSDGVYVIVCEGNTSVVRAPLVLSRGVDTKKMYSELEARGADPNKIHTAVLCAFEYKSTLNMFALSDRFTVIELDKPIDNKVAVTVELLKAHGAKLVTYKVTKLA